NLRHDKTYAAIRDLFARSVATARAELRTRSQRTKQSRSTWRDAVGRVLRRRRNREFDAGSNTRLCQPADGSLRNRARRGNRDVASFSGALERECRGGPVRDVSQLVQCWCKT